VINLNDYDNVELYQDVAENVLPQLEIHPEIALVDPPRAGMTKGALQGLLQLTPKTLVYVSCDPSTLARDMRVLVNSGYRLESITPFRYVPPNMPYRECSYHENFKKNPVAIIFLIHASIHPYYLLLAI
jgi:23S rRNA (uracil1939-C5)-methyltransferase